MLSDRSYLRRDDPRRRTSVTVWLVAALAAAYIIELIIRSPWFGSGTAMGNITLTIRSLQAGHLWTLFTHALVHSPVNPFHILATILGLVFIGRELEPLLGARRFLAVFSGAVFLGALGWTAAHWAQGGEHLGASAGVLGLFIVLACLYPDQETRFLLFFVFPVTLRPRFFILAVLTLDACGLIFYELQSAEAPFGLSPSVHLGGMLAGWIYVRFFHANNGWDRAAGFQMPAWMKRRTPGQTELGPSDKPSSPRSLRDFRAEVDRILDKINSEGFGALTEEEKGILDEAKDLLSRH